MLDVQTDMQDPPFGCPPDIVLDIPVPPSVNCTRRVNLAALRIVEKWHVHADRALMASGQYRTAIRTKPVGAYELKIILCEQKCRCDADNIVKAGIDYLRRLELVRNDSPKYLRKFSVEWGEAPRGCRIIIRGVEAA